jgi:hypothetical protein
MTRIAFLHIPKAGGTSMLSALSAHFPEHKICPERLNGLGDWPSAKLSEYDLFAGHFVFDALSLVPDPKVTFTMLREPKARMLSWYYYVRAHPRDHLEKHDPFLLPMRDQSLTEYLASDRATRDGNWMTELIGNSDLDLALARLKQFTALGILEREWATCLNLRLRLGVKIKGLPRENLLRSQTSYARHVSKAERFDPSGRRALSSSKPTPDAASNGAALGAVSTGHARVC